VPNLQESKDCRAPQKEKSMGKNPHAIALGRAGGKVKSEAKAAAARENGKKGGRPKQQQKGKEYLLTSG
jgi:hypothetical protein